MNFNQYKVDENGVGTPVNPYKEHIPYNIDDKEDCEKAYTFRERYFDFNQWAQANTIQTVGVEPGVYEVPAFKRDHFRFWDGSQWYKISDEEFFSDDYSRYEPFNEFESLVGSVYTLKEETPTDNKESVDVTGVESVEDPYKNEPIELSRNLFANTEHARKFLSDHDWRGEDIPHYKVEILLTRYAHYHHNPELTRLKSLVEKYEKALQEIEHDLDQLDRFELNIPKLRKIATNALNQ